MDAAGSLMIRALSIHSARPLPTSLCFPLHTHHQFINTVYCESEALRLLIPPLTGSFEGCHTSRRNGCGTVRLCLDSYLRRASGFSTALFCFLHSNFKQMQSFELLFGYSTQALSHCEVCPEASHSILVIVIVTYI